jgi:hypothetical protein
MKKSLVAGGLAVAFVFAGVMYFARDPAPEAATAALPPEKEGSAEPLKPAVPAPLPVSRSGTPPRPAPSDPRLAALMGSPADALIEYTVGDNGQVIKEIDNDPNSAGYRKPLREYTYAGDKLIALVAYRYLGGQVQIVRAIVTYKPDGSVDEYRESTSYDFGKKAADG